MQKDRNCRRNISAGFVIVWIYYWIKISFREVELLREFCLFFFCCIHHIGHNIKCIIYIYHKTAPRTKKLWQNACKSRLFIILTSILNLTFNSSPTAIPKELNSWVLDMELLPAGWVLRPFSTLTVSWQNLAQPHCFKIISSSQMTQETKKWSTLHYDWSEKQPKVQRFYLLHLIWLKISNFPIDSFDYYVTTSSF